MVDGNLLKLKFLRTGACYVYTWYPTPESFWHNTEDIIGKLPQPTLIPGRGIHMKFDRDAVEKCKKYITCKAN
jgi:hypothetical protein